MEIKDLILPNTEILLFDTVKSKNLKKLARNLNIDYSIIKLWNNWVQINGIWYYYKNFYNYKNSIKNFLNELIGEFLAFYLNLDTVTYHIGSTINEKGEIEYGLLSENFRDKKEKYIIPTDLGLDLNCVSLDNILELKKICKSNENYIQLTEQIFKMIAIDIYMNQSNRSKNNFLFQKKRKQLYLSPLYDYEKAFIVSNERIDNLKYKACIFGVNIEDKSEINQYPEIKYLLDLLLSLDINQIFDEISENHKLYIPVSEREEYKENVEKRKTLIKKCIK